ncbi:hypothetical protein Rhopal_004505-T1 [Rhodotorula paludigena]|uniref:Xylanolytic transcriptional activator regulatory domain-containing protein n=1 Tax=Rhodotorula paludigena TaxID=86838 RepID=A0AAV5GQ39_9BASI|nr:hypothetical protein Rhopal_004505-T1 [Rhodotorula paludigena]
MELPTASTSAVTLDESAPLRHSIQFSHIVPTGDSSRSILGNKLVGQAVEFGFCSVEVVQALILLAHHKKPDDATSWRRVGYAIRMAQELRLNVRVTRPLPPDETEARWQLNQERCWLNLIIADYHLAIHHSLPRMIAEEGVNEPADWVLEHEHLPCAGESLLAPWITFSRICRLYSDMLNGMNGDPANMRSLRWLEQRWKRWKDKWLDKQPVFQKDFVRPGFVPFCVNLTWVALAVVTVWLVKLDRDCIIRALQDIQSSTKKASVTPDDMSGYMHRLVTHLLGSISPAWHLTTLAAPTPVPASPLPRPTQPAPQPHSAHLAQYQHPNVVLSATSDGSVGWPFVSSQQLIQEGLYANPPPPMPGQVLSNGQTMNLGAPIAVPYSGPPHALPTQDDALFPTADDDIWRLLFPAADTAAFAV